MSEPARKNHQLTLPFRYSEESLECNSNAILPRLS